MAYQGLSIFEGVTIKNINIFVMILQMCNVIPLQWPKGQHTVASHHLSYFHSPSFMVMTQYDLF
jgi:hypothetical protein